MIRNKSNSKIQDFLPLIFHIIIFPQGNVFADFEYVKKSASNDTKYVDISFFSTPDIFFRSDD